MKISIVTPVLNGKRFIAETIESVITQKGDFAIEYIIVDGISSDGTQEIIQKYQRLIKNNLWIRHCKSITIRLISEKDSSMYDAVNKGMAIVTGDICAYINSDDVYLPGAFQNIVRIFRWKKQIAWLKGITSYIDESSSIQVVGDCYVYDRRMIQKGVYGRYTYFIQQDSVFWRRGLWEKCGPIDTKYLLAGDFYLWSKFAKHAKLYSLMIYISCFRTTKGQLTQNMKRYLTECDALIPYSKLLAFKYMLYHKYFQYRVPKLVSLVASLVLLGVQDLNKIVIQNNKFFLWKPKLYV